MIGSAASKRGFQDSQTPFTFRETQLTTSLLTSSVKRLASTRLILRLWAPDKKAEGITESIVVGRR